MKRYLLLRLLRMGGAAWGIVSVIFLLSRTLAPPELLDNLAENSLTTITASGKHVAEQSMRRRLDLDQPLFYLTFAGATAAHPWHWNGLHNQYHTWFAKAFRGDLGRSYHDDRPVIELLIKALRYTLPLTLSAALMAIGLAFACAIGLAQRSFVRRVFLVLLYGLDAMPLFVVASGLLLLLASPDAFPLFPAFGLGYQTRPAASWLAGLTDYCYHLALPLTSLVLVSLPGLVVQLDAALQRERGTEYAVTARAKGLSEQQVIYRHALRNALLPMITLLTDFLPALVGGAVVVEVIFSLPGMGLLLAEAAASRDYPVLLGGIVLVALARLLAQLLADWLYMQADPRIRLHS